MGVISRQWFSKADWLRQEPSVRVEKTRLGTKSVLHIKSIACIKKNDFSREEVVIFGFWSTKNGDISGQLRKEVIFRRKGETQNAELNIPIGELLKGSIFFLMFYEEDAAPLDPDDSIGAIALFGNQSIAVYVGDFRKQSKPKKIGMVFGKTMKIDLNAKAAGHYAVNFQIGE